jgi:ABC-type branched-subunit amino acid transport system substrate-binding protein
MRTSFRKRGPGASVAVAIALATVAFLVPTTVSAASPSTSCAPAACHNTNRTPHVTNGRLSGYWLVAADGGIFSFSAPFFGSTGSIHLNQPIKGMASTPDGGGYWLVARDGGVFTFGDANFYGSTGSLKLNAPMVGMAPTPDGGGYWLVASDGGIFAFGDAGYYGSAASVPGQDIVGMAVMPDGRGYWEVSTTGRVFAYGDAVFEGDASGLKLGGIVAGIVEDPATAGYWLVATDGGIFAFNAPFLGSTGNIHLNQPVLGMSTTPDGQGYWMVARDGGVFSFGDASFYGSTGSIHLNQPMVGMATSVSPLALTTQNFDITPQSEAGYCTGTVGNTASAPGVTPTTVTVGNVSGLTGPIAGEYGQGLAAVSALFSAVDAAGGICGRGLAITSADDQQNASVDGVQVGTLSSQVLAFVGSLSDADSGGVAALTSTGVPDIGPAIDENRSNAPTYWSATGAGVDVVNGQSYIPDTLTGGLSSVHNLPTKIAILADNLPSFVRTAQEYAALFQSAGVTVCYSNYLIPVTQGSFASNVTAMQQAGCTGTFDVMDQGGTSRLLQAMQQASYAPSYVGASIDAYTTDTTTAVNESNGRGLQVAVPSLPLNEANPGVQLYESQMATYQPGQIPSEYGFEAWADAQLFLYALIKSGHNPTRASLVNAMASVTNWSVGGAFAPYTPSTRSAAPCAVDTTVGGSGFTRTWPATGLLCGTSLIDVGPAG